MDDKYIFGIVALVLVTGIQAAAWILGYNGQVFAFTSLVFGLIVGKLLNISFKK